MTTLPNTHAPLRTPHRLLAALVLVTFPLIWVGGLVTTYTAGMAVPDWPTTYGYNPFLYPWHKWVSGPFDLFVEHGHRLLAMLAGLLAILLVVAAWVKDAPRWLRWLAVAALAGVIAQGVLGGLRVVFDARQLAKIHGCVGPLFFAYCVALWELTGRRWQRAVAVRQAGTVATRVLMATTLGLAYLQLVLGAHVRHLPLSVDHRDFALAVGLHIIGAGALLLMPLVLALRARRHHADARALRRPISLLALLVTVQVALGCLTWLVNYGWPVWFDRWPWAAQFTIQVDSLLQSLTTTAHVATGSLILAVATVGTLRSFRDLQTIPATAAQPSFTLETAR